MTKRLPDVIIIEDRFQVYAVEVLEGSRFGKRGLKGNTVYYLYRGYQVLDDGEAIKVDNSIADKSDGILLNNIRIIQIKRGS